MTSSASPDTLVIGSVLTVTPFSRSFSAISAGSSSGPWVHSTTSSLNRSATYSASIASCGTVVMTARVFPLVSQPWQKGQWKTPRPNRSARPGMS